MRMGERVYEKLFDHTKIHTRAQMVEIIERESGVAKLIEALEKAKKQISVFALSDSAKSIAAAYCQEIDWAIEGATGERKNFDSDLATRCIALGADPASVGAWPNVKMRRFLGEQ